FFSSRRRHTSFSRDWSSDVCSSELLDDHLAGLDALQDLGADRLLARAIGEAAHDLEGDIRLDQCPAYLAQCCLHVLLAERAAARQSVENSAKPLLKRFKHVEFLVLPGPGPSGQYSAAKCQTPKRTCIRGRNALPDVDLRDRTMSRSAL